MTEVVQLDVGLSISGAEDEFTLAGTLAIGNATQLSTQLPAPRPGRRLVVDLGGVDRIDTAGAWVLTDLARRVEQSSGEFQIRNASADAILLLDNVRNAMPVKEIAPPGQGVFFGLLDATGRTITDGTKFLLELMGYVGLFIAKLVHVMRHPSEFRLTALVAHCEDVGLRAVPIVALMAFLIGVVLAFQGSAQLQQFGAEVFVIDLIAISVLRELGILLTAIIVAGRTASAFTAAIGSMKMREEIDAMRTLGLDPAKVLFVPRILALLLMLPILGLVADIMGLFGGALMAWIDLGISPSMFRTRLIEGTGVGHLFVGLIKAPAFALIIGVVGCHAGMQVKGNAESLGRMTSNAVVAAIFAVILVDALFSIFFAQVGI